MRFWQVPKHIEVLNDEVGELCKRMAAMQQIQATTQNDLGWLKDKVIPRIEREIWLVFGTIILTALAFWLFR